MRIMMLEPMFISIQLLLIYKSILYKSINYAVEKEHYSDLPY